MSKYGFQGWPGSTRKIVVYDYGNERTNVTGGWVSFASGCTMTRQPASLRGVAPNTNSTYGTWVADRMVDYTPFKWQYIEVNIADMGEGCFFGGGIVKNVRPMDTAPNVTQAIVGAFGTGIGVLRADIRAQDRSLYPYFYVGGANYGNVGGTMDMIKMWFE